MQNDNRIGEECGVFAIYDPDGDCARTTYYGLYALQHRGQESCGIAVNNNRDITHYKDMGLVNDVFNDEILTKLDGKMAVGHVRYSTTGESMRENAQPLVLRYVKGNIAIAHNGNLVNKDELAQELSVTGAIFQTTTDTEMIAYTIAKERLNSKSVEEAVEKTINHLVGAFSLIVMSPQKLIAARDPWGFRPLCMGKKGDAIVFASETCALDSVGAEFVRDIEPGEIVVVQDGKISTIRTHVGKQPHTMCIFEYLYFARPDSIIEGQSAHDSRMLAGKYLAQEFPVEADVVIGVPDSGLSAAMGYAKESGIPYDSIVRGTTSKRIVSLLRHFGATEVHVRSSAPPFMFPCYFGTDVPSKDQLVACNYTMDGIKELIGADSIGFLSVNSLEKIIPNANCQFCDGCFSGKYPVDVD